LEQELIELHFTRDSLVSSYYKLRYRFNATDYNTYYSLFAVALLKYRVSVEEFFLESPKECLSMVKEARNNFFSAFFFHILSFIRIFKGCISFNVVKLIEATRIVELSNQFKSDCGHVFRTFWSATFSKNDNEGLQNRIEAFEIFLWIMKRFVDCVKGSPEGQRLNSSYEKYLYVRKNFEFDVECFPSYEVLLKTFNILRVLSINHAGNLQKDKKHIIKLIRLFRLYCGHFRLKLFAKLPARTPLLLTLFVLDQQNYNSKKLFILFSKDPIVGLLYSNYPCILLSKDPIVGLLYSNHPFRNLVLDTIRILSIQEGKTLNGHEGVETRQRRNFVSFLQDLINQSDIYRLREELKSGIVPELSEEEIWMIRPFLKLMEIAYS
jgi:hypothetical protein